MRTMFGAILVAMGMIAAANAQTNQPPSHAPTARSPLFGSDWARPFPETGGYFYNDPRLRNSNQPQRPVVCRRGGVC
jgi:hypothetical protein